MRTRAYALALIVAFAPVALATPDAYAQDAMTEMARRNFQEGVRFFDAKKYEEARASFTASYALKKHPVTLKNLAESELRSGHPVESARHYVQYLRTNTTATASERADAEKSLAEARQKTARVQISVSAANADVLVDGELVGTSPLADAIDVGAGTHTVEARLAGKSVSKSVAATIGKVITTDLSFDGGAPPVAVVAPVPAPATGSQPAAAAPPPPAPPIPTLNPDGTMPGSPPPADTAALSTEGREAPIHWLTHNKLAWIGLGVTAVGLGLGVGFTVAAGKAGDNADSLANDIRTDALLHASNHSANGICSSTNAADIKRYSGPCSDYQNDLDQRTSDKHIATAGFVIAGLGVVGTGVAYFLTSKPKDGGGAPAAVVVPTYAPGFAGLAAGGAF